MECPHCHRQVRARDKNCSSCGGHIPAGQYLLEEAGIDKTAAAVSASGPVAARNVPLPRTATLGDRLAAFVLDTIVLFGLFAVVDAWIFMRWGTVVGAELDLSLAAVLLAAILNAVILFGYGWLLEASFGATLGKFLVGIRVVRTQRRSALVASAIRNLLRIVDGFGFYLLGAMVATCSPRRQRLGDLWAGTAVVEEDFGIATKAVTLVAWAAILAGSVWAVPRICAEDHAQEHVRYLDQVVVQAGKSESSGYLQIARFRIDIRLTSRMAAN